MFYLGIHGAEILKKKTNYEKLSGEVMICWCITTVFYFFLTSTVFNTKSLLNIYHYIIVNIPFMSW